MYFLLCVYERLLKVEASLYQQVQCIFEKKYPNAVFFLLFCTTTTYSDKYRKFSKFLIHVYTCRSLQQN